MVPQTARSAEGPQFHTAEHHQCSWHRHSAATHASWHSRQWAAAGESKVHVLPAHGGLQDQLDSVRGHGICGLRQHLLTLTGRVLMVHPDHEGAAGAAGTVAWRLLLAWLLVFAQGRSRASLMRQYCDYATPVLGWIFKSCTACRCGPSRSRGDKALYAARDSAWPCNMGTY